MGLLIRISSLSIGILLSVSAQAAVVESMLGDVRAGATAESSSAIHVGQRIDADVTVLTGEGSRVLLRFDDGQIVLLNDNTEFRIAKYDFTPTEPAKDSFVFDLLRGAVRSKTVALTHRNPQAYVLRTPQASISIRDADGDLMAMLVNPAYILVTNGTIGVSNAAGNTAFAAGATGTIGSSTALAVGIPASALPSGVVVSFSSMGSFPVVVGMSGGAGGTTGGTGGTVGGTTGGTAGTAGGSSLSTTLSTLGGTSLGGAATAVGAGALTIGALSAAANSNPSGSNSTTASATTATSPK